jgi:uncharacterized membrane protein YdjX (TVP38/TMEM64 family)
MPTTSQSAPPGPSLHRWLLAAALVGLVGGFYALGGHRYLSWEVVRAQLDTWQAQAEAHLLLSLLVFFAVYVVVTGLSLPIAVFLSLVGGALFGRWLGTAVVSLAATLGATLAFLLSRYLLRDWVQRRFGARLEPINRGVQRDGAYYLFTLRLVPAVPFWLINLGMGLTPMRAGTFAVVSWLGMLIGTFLYVNVGATVPLRELDSPRALVDPGVLASLALLGLVPLLIRLLLRRLRAQPRA